MKITIIGAGNMAGGIGSRVVTSKHSLVIQDRDEEKAKDLAKKLGKGVEGKNLDENINGDIIIFALPYVSIPEVMKQYEKSLAGKILVDISNPVDFNTFEIIPARTTSGAEEISKHLPEDARLVKAFNTNFAGTLAKGAVDGQKLDVFIVSDDKEAAETVVTLVDESGMRGLYVGALSKAQTLEGIALINMTLQEKLGSNWMSAIKILS